MTSNHTKAGVTIAILNGMPKSLFRLPGRPSSGVQCAQKIRRDILCSNEALQSLFSNLQWLVRVELWYRPVSGQQVFLAALLLLTSIHDTYSWHLSLHNMRAQGSIASEHPLLEWFTGILVLSVVYSVRV